MELIEMSQGNEISRKGAKRMVKLMVKVLRNRVSFLLGITSLGRFHDTAYVPVFPKEVSRV